MVGAGPAGSTTAFRLSRKGYQVLLVDMARFPRDKVCGDSLITGVSKNLERMGLYDSIRKAGSVLEGISIYSPGGVNFSVDGDIVTIKRRYLDTRLAEAAVRSGAVFCCGHLDSLDVADDHTVTVRDRKGKHSVRCKFAVLATGAHMGLARRIEGMASDKPSAIAARCYVKSRANLNHLVLCYDRRLLPGYGWIVPLGNGEYNIGCGYFLNGKQDFNLRRCFESFTTTFPLAREIMEDSEVLSPLRSGALRCDLENARPVFKKSVLMVGEIIGATFPLTGEGIGQAMTCGDLAAQAIDRALSSGDRSAVESYTAGVESIMKPVHAGYMQAQKWVSKPWLNDFMARRVKKSVYLRNACTEFITKSGDPRKLYSVSSVLKSFWQ